MYVCLDGLAGYTGTVTKVIFTTRCQAHQVEEGFVFYVYARIHLSDNTLREGRMYCRAADKSSAIKAMLTRLFLIEDRNQIIEAWFEQSSMTGKIGLVSSFMAGIL